MKYTWRSALVDALIVVVVALLFGIGFHFSESGPQEQETGLFSQIFIALYIYTIATVFLLSHFFPYGSGFLYTADVLCCKVMMPPHEGGGITWGIFGYIMGTACLVFAFVGEGDPTADNRAEQDAAHQLDPAPSRKGFSELERFLTIPPSRSGSSRCA